ncbi:hypothetical protein SAMN05216268_120104 [Streptomyces yunnanensis]|uniref:Secreted protein n=1 Tax=Streptomyces yunnanensis TaxID=156453 RepID=A0A9X8QYQ7_9ACTN|nr:hypothetical protein SAMN05216268_120104 [Streptomyces yunnanensis]
MRPILRTLIVTPLLTLLSCGLVASAHAAGVGTTGAPLGLVNGVLGTLRNGAEALISFVQNLFWGQPWPVPRRARRPCLRRTGARS